MKYRITGELIKEAGPLNWIVDGIAKAAPKIEQLGGNAIDKATQYGKRIDKAFKARGYNPNYKKLAVGGGLALGGTYLGAKAISGLIPNGRPQQNPQQTNLYSY